MQVPLVFFLCTFKVRMNQKRNIHSMQLFCRAPGEFSFDEFSYTFIDMVFCEMFKQNILKIYVVYLSVVPKHVNNTKYLELSIFQINNFSHE